MLRKVLIRIDEEQLKKVTLECLYADNEDEYDTDDAICSEFGWLEQSGISLVEIAEA